MKYLLILLLVGIGFVGCNNDDNGDNTVACTEIFIYGLSINVTDAVTGEAISEGVTVTATDGNYSEDLMYLGDSWLGAGERPPRHL